VRRAGVLRERHQLWQMGELDMEITFPAGSASRRTNKERHSRWKDCQRGYLAEHTICVTVHPNRVIMVMTQFHICLRQAMFRLESDHIPFMYFLYIPLKLPCL